MAAGAGEPMDHPLPGGVGRGEEGMAGGHARSGARALQGAVTTKLSEQ